jgi:hypothetical protein
VITPEHVAGLRARYGWTERAPDPERVRERRPPVEINQCPDCGQRTYLRRGRRYAFARRLGPWVAHVCPKRPAGAAP